MATRYDAEARLAGPRTEGRSLPSGAIDGVEVEVVEVTGRPGDAYLLDMRILHAGAPNASTRPRIMTTHRFWRADKVEELAEAYGWLKPPNNARS
jgi:ectoine hydroxylase-related dioxygenase (phytanoyl-CoA dioxygenase family)